MGFRNNAYATVWEVQPKRDTNTTVRISTSRKNKQTGEYETDFSGFVGFVGTVAAQQAAKLKSKDRIMLKEVDVKTNFDKEKRITYTNFFCYDFELPDNKGASQPKPKPEKQVDDGEVEDDDLPF